MVILKIAWRNIWRNKVRSLVVITAIALGLWAGTFASGFYEGMIDQKIEDVINNEYAHFQVHDSLFREELLLMKNIKGHQAIVDALAADDSVKAFTSRTIISGMFASSRKTGALRLLGIDPTSEAAVTGLDQRLIDGAYFEGIKRNPILISKKTAETYGLDLRNKVVVTAQDAEGEIVAASFRVVGIFSSNNGMFDGMNAYVLATDVQRMLSLSDDHYHEIAVMLKENGLAESYAEKYAKRFPEQEVLPWLDLAMGMRYMVEASGTFSFVIVAIILFALLFSIVNTMLMAVMERTREIGMLKAVGLSRGRVFAMIMIETLLLSMVGAPIGMFATYLIIQRTGEVGIDLGEIGETYSDLGFSAVVYPSLDLQTYFSIGIMVLFMALIAALYPALKAVRLNASEAIRKI